MTQLMRPPSEKWLHAPASKGKFNSPVAGFGTGLRATMNDRFRPTGEVRRAPLLTFIHSANFSKTGRRHPQIPVVYFHWNAGLICAEMNGCIHWNTHLVNVRCRTVKLPWIPDTEGPKPTGPPTMKLNRLVPHGAIALAVFSGFVLFAFPMTSHATEEPEYKVVQKLDEMEVREYAAYTVAEVVVPGTAAEAGNLAFPILAGYIFGKNKGERKFAMTAPVTQTATPDGFRVQFVLPKGVTLTNAPEPLDTRVTLRDVAPSRVAVIRYSGVWSDANYNQHLANTQ